MTLFFQKLFLLIFYDLKNHLLRVTRKSTIQLCACVAISINRNHQWRHAQEFYVFYISNCEFFHLGSPGCRSARRGLAWV